MSTPPPNGPSEQIKRENADPDEGVRPLPWFLIMFLGAMTMWGAFYIYITPSGDESMYGDQRTVAQLRPPEAAAGGGAKADGQQVYTSKCVACHQATGLGVTGVFPPLAASEWVTGDAKLLARILLHGISGEMHVAGATYNGAMPSWKQLSDDELAALMSHLRSQWGNKASPIDAALVKAERDATQARSSPYQGAKELLAEAQ